jgi:hypothetical protein
VSYSISNGVAFDGSANGVYAGLTAGYLNPQLGGWSCSLLYRGRGIREGHPLLAHPRQFSVETGEVETQFFHQGQLCLGKLDDGSVKRIQLREKPEQGALHTPHQYGTDAAAIRSRGRRKRAYQSAGAIDLLQSPVQGRKVKIVGRVSSRIPARCDRHDFSVTSDPRPLH